MPRPRLLVTLGDPCGIGPELLLDSLPALGELGEIQVVGPRAAMALLGREVPSLPWFDPTPDLTPDDLTLGQPSAASGRGAVEAVRMGAQKVMAGEADALVTLPLSKTAAHLAGYRIPGHTEFLQTLSGSPMTRMAFLSPTLNVVLHTVHQSLRSVLDGITATSVAETLAFAADRYAQLSGNLEPRVALCALNPHAGEAGAFGQEELYLHEAVVIAEAAFLAFDGDPASGPFPEVPSPFPPGPAPQGWHLYPRRSTPGGAPTLHQGLSLQTPRKLPPLTRMAPRFFGPLPSDSLFLRAAKGEFDLVVALFHDQGLIPMKVLEPDRAVNLTLGLPFIRTSPDHGTAFEIAGLGRAENTNFMAAAALATQLTERLVHGSHGA